MFKSILVPLDGSALSARALPLAKRMALAAGARLIVVRAHLPADDLGLRLGYPELSPAERADVERTAAESEFRSAIDELRADGRGVRERVCALYSLCYSSFELIRSRMHYVWLR